MQIIENKIVFSNDIYKILKGNNSLDYNYESNGIIIPSKNFIEELRNDFQNTTKKIFEGNIEIITEKQMQSSIENSIKDILGRLPHCIIRQNLFKYR